MFCRRSLLSRIRDAAIFLAVPSIATSIGRRTADAQEKETTPDAQDKFQIMPFDNPPFGAPPLTFGKRSGVTVIVKTDVELVKSLVPAPLKPVGPELMIQQHMNTIEHPLRVRYPNATVIVPVSMNDKEGFYMARVYEGSPDATMLTIWGREIWGFPKIAADTNVYREGNRTTRAVKILKR